MTRCTVRGADPVNDDAAAVPNSERLPDGQFADHWIMCPGEVVEAGFVRPVRLSYKHERCGGITRVPQPIAATYAANPSYYGSTFCYHCRDYFPVGPNGEFVWQGTKDKVGS
jgi:hypothetical protein